MVVPDFSSFLSIIDSHELIQVNRRPDLFRYRLKIVFNDETVLHARENHLPILNWREYSYQWQTASHELIIRWDNAHELHVTPVPAHHQHVGSEENVQPSKPMTLTDVLTIIAEQLTSGS